MRTLLGTLDGGTLRIYTRDGDDVIDQVGQLVTPLDHTGALRLLSDLDLLNGWTRNGAVVAAVGHGGGGAAPVRTAATLDAAPPRRRGHRLDYSLLLDAALPAAAADGMTFGDMADFLGISRTHGGLKTRVDTWRRDGIVRRDDSRPYRYRLGTEPRRRAPGGAAARRAALLAYAVEHGSIRSGDARRLYPDVNDASLHGDLGWLVAHGGLVRTGTPASGRGGDPRGTGYVWTVASTS